MIRKAIIEDLSIIQVLNNKLFDLELKNFDKDLKANWPLTSNGKAYFQDLILNHIVFVAQKNNKIIGYIAGRVHKEDSYTVNQFAELENMYVESSFQSKGIGTLLINKFKEECTSKEICSIKVTASYSNKKAIEFYKKNLFNNKDITLLYKKEQ